MFKGRKKPTANEKEATPKGRFPPTTRRRLNPARKIFGRHPSNTKVFAIALIAGFYRIIIATVQITKQMTASTASSLPTHLSQVPYCT